MTWKKLLSQNLKLTFAVTLVIFGSTNSPTRVQAEPTFITNQEDYRLLPKSAESSDVPQIPFNTNDLPIFVQPEAAKKGAPGRRKGGGSFSGSNQCKSTNQPLTALIPGVEETLSERQKGTSPAIASTSVRGLTADGYPTFWFYVPYTSTAALSAEFVLINNKNKLVYKDTYLLNGTPGIVSIRPSAKLMSAPLEVGKDYRWVLSILCDPNDRSADVYVDGWVQRVALSPKLATDLRTATPEKRAVIYAQEGLWYETLTALIEELYPRQSNQAKLLMDNLLQSVGLDGFAQQPIIQCCTSKNS